MLNNRSGNKKQNKETLSRLCIKYFGEDFEHWSWEVNSGNVPSYPMKIASAIELPKYDIKGDFYYTDPFIAYSGGASKSLDMCCCAAIEWVNQKFKY